MRGGQGLVGAWQLHPASGHEDGEVGVDRPAVVAGGGGSSGRVDMPASSSSCRSGGGGSRVSALASMGYPGSGSLVIGCCPMDSGKSPPGPCPWKDPCLGQE